MYTAADVDALLERLKADGMSKAETVRSLARACMGWPYVFGAWGDLCTPRERRTRAQYNPQHQSKIYGACQALSGEKASCEGCRWQGCGCFDCRGFTHRVLAWAGIDLHGQGATTQYETAGNWAARGEIGALPPGITACVFKRKNGKMSHTGLYLGSGEIVHCSGTVKPGTLGDNPPWTHWGIPAGLYTDDELRKAGINVEGHMNVPTIRKGSTGELVELLQASLNDEIDAGLVIDGIFGSATERAVKFFQSTNGLKADGIVGPKTWAALGVDFDSEDAPEIPDDEKPEADPDLPDESHGKPPDEQPEMSAPPGEEPDNVPVNRHMLEVWANQLEDMAALAPVLEAMAADMRGYAGHM